MTRRWQRLVCQAVLLATLALVGTTFTARASDVLPTGFGAINVGAAWADVEGLYPYTDLSDASTLLERLNQECGYKTVLRQTPDGELMVTIRGRLGLRSLSRGHQEALHRSKAPSGDPFGA